MKNSEIEDKIGDYRGWVRIIGNPAHFKLRKPFGTVLGPDPKDSDNYQVALAAPAINPETGEQILTISEYADKLRKIRYDRKLLPNLIAEKGLAPKDYELFFTTGEGEYFLTRPGFFAENASGFLVTRQLTHYSWWLDQLPDSQKLGLTEWKQIKAKANWLESNEYTKALNKMLGVRLPF